MTITRVTASVAQNGSGTTIAGASFTASAGGLIFVTICHDSGDGIASIADTAGNTYTAIGQIDNGSQREDAWYRLSSAAQAGNVITVTLASVITGIKTLAQAHYTTTSTGFVYDTTASIQGAFGANPVVTSSFNTAGAGVVVAGVGDLSVQVETLATSGSLTFQASAAGTASFRAGALADAIYTSAQTGVTAGVSVGTSSKLWAYAASFTEIAASVQLLRPASDISAGTWAPSSGGTLFAMLNEVTANDATIIATSQTGTASVAFAAGASPGVTTGHIVRTRTIGAVTVTLMQGATVIASWSQTSTVLTTFAQTLTGVQAAAITNYAALSLQFQAT